MVNMQLLHHSTVHSGFLKPCNCAFLIAGLVERGYRKVLFKPCPRIPVGSLLPGGNLLVANKVPYSDEYAIPLVGMGAYIRRTVAEVFHIFSAQRLKRWQPH